MTRVQANWTKKPCYMSHLQGTICEVHDDSPGCPEPSLERRNSGELVALAHFHVRSSLQQVFLHVVPEVLQQLHLLLQLRGILFHCVVMFIPFKVDVMNIAEERDDGESDKKNLNNKYIYLLSIGQHKELGHVIEEHADALVAEGITEAVFVRIVDPFTYPDHWQALGVLSLVLHGLRKS